MSRMVLAPVSGSLSHTTRRMVTFRGTANVMPRSWHSSTSYLSFRPTGSSQVSQVTGVLLLRWPHFGQWISRSPRGSMMMVAAQNVQGRPSLSRPTMRPHLHSQFPIAYSTNSSEQFSRRSVIGKTLLKTDCRPASSRSLGRTRICRKRSYEFFWISMRLGIGIEVLIFWNPTRSR